MGLRDRLENSVMLERAFGGAAAGFFGLAQRRTAWRIEGLDDLRGFLSAGPVLYLCWHSRLLMAIAQWPRDAGQMTTIHNHAPIGRVGAEVARRQGLDPVVMRRRGSNREVSRKVLKAFRAGNSIGMAADGPIGPAHRVSAGAMEWARITGAPIVGYAFSTTRGHRADSWDRMLLPLPFAEGAAVFEPFDHPPLSRQADEAGRKAFRAAIAAHLDRVTARADAMLGLPPGP